MRDVFAVVAGVVAAFAVMLAFEYANSLLFPFPGDMGSADIDQLRTFAASLPVQALILVLLGWIFGSLAAGAVTARLATRPDATAIAAGLILTAGGFVNAWIIQEPLWFHFGGLPLFFAFTLLGSWLARGRGGR